MIATGAGMLQVILRHKAAGGDGELRYRRAELRLRSAQEESLDELFAVADVIGGAGETIAIGERRGEGDRRKGLTQKGGVGDLQVIFWCESSPVGGSDWSRRECG